MNYRRMLLGALLAGVLILVSEWVLNGVVLADEMQADMERMGLHYASWAMASYVVMPFIYGLFLAWGYAAVRSRYGPGAGTALMVAAALWLVGYLIPTVGFLGMGIGSAGPYALALVWGAVELALASLLAGYVYRES